MIVLVLPLLTLVAPAVALDGHGPAAAPCSPTALGPVVAWSPGAAAAGTWSGCAEAEIVERPVVATIVDGNKTQEIPALTDVFGVHVGGTYGFGRVGLGVDVPLWLNSVNFDEQNGAALGDIRVYAPISLVRGSPGGLGVDVVAEGVLPTGDASILLGGGAGGAAHLVFGGHGERLGGTADLAVGYSAGETLPGLDTALFTRLALSGDWSFSDRVGAGAELWFQVAPLAGSSILVASPGEALLRVGGEVSPGVSLTAAGGTAISPGIGAAEVRGYLRAAFHPAPPKRVAAPIVTVAPPPPPGPFDVLVSVRDGEGKPVDAALVWEGAGVPADSTCGADGEARATLAPGSFALRVSAAGFGAQRRDFVLSADRFRPERVEVILLPQKGDQTLRLGVEDSEGRAVDRATVTVDGAQIGSTATGGHIELGGVAAGDHVVTVAQTDFREHGAVNVAIPQAAEGDLTVTLQRPPGSVRVVTRGFGVPIPDARVRFSGPEDVPAQNVGADGERTFTLLPGHWILVASAADLGTQEREFEVEAGKTALVVLDVKMIQSEAGNGRLVVRVVDPEGNPVDDAAIGVDGQDVGHTGNGGSLTLGELKAGERTITAHNPRFRDATPRVLTLGDGTREVTLALAWRPGQVHVVSRGVEGGVVDTRIRFSGPEEVPAAALGADGEGWFELASGHWIVGISSPAYGLQEREVDVCPDDVALVELDAALLSADGDSWLDLDVAGPGKVALAGAGVWLDNKPAGTTASGGALHLGGLRAGKHELRVEATGFKPRARSVTLGAGHTTIRAELDILARPVDAMVTTPSGPAVDALVRGYGTLALPPMPVDYVGHRKLELDPGPWTLVAVSELFGLAEEDVLVKSGTSVLPVSLMLHAPPVDRGSLVVDVVDPAGNPVQNATLTVAGTRHALGPTGVWVAEDRDLGKLVVEVAAPGYRPHAAEAIGVVKGVQTRRLRLEWAPRPVVVHVATAEGKPVEAEVRVLGPGRAAPVKTAAGDAHFSLLPGTWQVLASAPGFGPFRTEVDVLAGEAPVEVAAALAAEKVEVTRTSVVIREQVKFAFDKADIEVASHAVLGQVASTLLLHPEITRIEVQGHTDMRGTEAYNQDLSARRAEAVRAYLIGQGVEPGRIEAHGYGATRPLGDNTSEAGRAKNRRVQFEILTGTAP